MEELQTYLYVDIVDGCLKIIPQNLRQLRNSLKTLRLLIDGLEKANPQNEDELFLTMNTCRENIYRIYDLTDHEFVDEKMIRSATNFLDNKEKRDRKVKSMGASKYIYNYVTHLVSFINRNEDWEIIKETLKEEINVAINENKKPLTFLSYAFDDNIFAYFIYHFFKRNGGLIYIDSLMGEEHSNGKDIKEAIYPWIDKSKQFLFLRSMNSDSHQIRQWCSWEIGYAYNHVNKDRFFYVQVGLVTGSKSRLIDDFNKMMGIDKGIIF